MLEKLLQEITACESLAQENLRKAHAEAKEILIAAEAEIAKQNIASAERIKKMKAENIAKAEAAAAEICEKIIEQGKLDADDVIMRAKSVQDEIIQDITRRINS